MSDLKCYCGSPMKLKTSKFGKFYGCERWPECEGTASVHEDGRPMARPADKETKRARIVAHRVFDQLWQVRGWKRAEAYVWMAKAMDLTPEEAHIGHLDREQCIKLVKLVRDEVKNGEHSQDPVKVQKHTICH